MLKSEPVIHVGVIEGYPEVGGVLLEDYRGAGGKAVQGQFVARVEGGNLVVRDERSKEIAKGPEVILEPAAESGFTLRDVTIGVKFHWERKEEQRFEGGLRLVAGADSTVTAINVIGLESYLESVISSEMSAESPPELLKAHAITSRSWLAAMLDRERAARKPGVPARRSRETADEIVRWYDREDHAMFDVCADDHCQRYQGVTKIISDGAKAAVRDTRGVFLVYEDQVCDARFYKSCGGLTEDFENAWEDHRIPYLTSVSDADRPFPPLRTEQDAAAWIAAEPEAFCNTHDPAVIRQILPSFDQETVDFFRWTVKYGEAQLSELVKQKSGIDFGSIRELVPLQRGPSGRIVRLKIVGEKRTLVVGKELEIRRWLSKSHLYSSAFTVERKGKEFVLHGAGWGHGVGLCQIGAAMMATKGKKAEQIVKHYFPGAELRELYS